VRILLVTWYFPPVNTIGAVRLGKFARFLQQAGHDVAVVAGKNWGHLETLPLEAPVERIAYVPAFDVNALPSAVVGTLKRLLRRAPPDPTWREPAPAGAGASGAAASGAAASVHSLSRLYTELTNIPDGRIGWLNGATRAGIALCRQWRPDLIFASGPPFTAFLIARHLSPHLSVPWVAELRDRWADDPYDTSPRWRRALNDWLERRVLTTAKALVTVTEPWAEFYREKYAKPVATIYNGYDPTDLADLDAAAPPLAPNRLVIGYAGSIYPGRRDPTPLFEALRLLGETGDRFRVIFCGTNPAHVLPLAARAGVTHLVEIRPGIPYRESLAFQQRSDVLLLMQWNDPREQGNCPGKFFEYIASLRPMLILGLDNGVPATIARARGAGDCINDPPRIAQKLKEWLAEKDRCGRVRDLPEAAREGLSRDIQFAQLERFLAEMPARVADAS
jgi:glycosyltransferase involved in cell wall biosynthesis